MLRASLTIIVSIALIVLFVFCSLMADARSPKFYGQIVQSQAAHPTSSVVHLCGEELFDIPAGAGGFNRQERALAAERNLNNALVATRDRSYWSVEVVPINNIPVIRMGGKHIVTADAASALATGMSMQGLADEWANNIRRILSDQSRVEAYISELAGDYIAPNFGSPYHFARSEAARLNHAADLIRAELPPGLECSDVHKRAGFSYLNKRDPALAESEFRQAIAASQNNQRANYGLGVSLLKQGRIEEARKYLEVARWLDADDAEVHIALGQAAEALGLDGEAMSRYREASLLQPDNPTPLLYIADLREARNDVGRSVGELSESIRRLPDSRYLRVRRDDQLSWRLRKPY